MESTKLGFVSDAHGNPIGLQACLRAFEDHGVNRVWFLGDAVGYLPLGVEVLRILSARRIPCVLGNHDAMLCGVLPLDPVKDEVYGLARQKTLLDASVLSDMRQWPRRRLLHIGARRLLLVHGSPRDELGDYLYPDSPLDDLSRVEADVIFAGHGHRPFVRAVGNVTVVGVGSCGLPRDVGGQASCAIYDPSSGAVQLLRVHFDVARVISECSAVSTIARSVLDTLQRSADRSDATEARRG